MPAESDEPLRKVTLNLFAKDVAELERNYERGWTEEVRNMVRSTLKRYKVAENEIRISNQIGRITGVKRD